MARIQDLNSPDNIKKMREVKKDIERVILPMRHTVEAAIVAGACLQIAKTLLDLYPEGRREALIEGGVMLLEGYAGDQEMPTLIIPKAEDVKTIDWKEFGGGKKKTRKPH